MRQRRRRGLAVASGDREDSAAIPFPEEVHLAGQRDAGIASNPQKPAVLRDGGADNDQIGIKKIPFVVMSQRQSNGPRGIELS